jgi:signal transduction histidine kinase
LFVDRHLQGALLYRIAIYWCFSVLTVCLVTLCFRAVTYASQFDSFFDYFAFGEFFSRYGIVVLASLVLLPVIMLDVLIISNRFAGPLYRMRRSMRALAAGEHVQPINFREKDFLQDLANEFNAVAHRMEQLQNELDQAKRQSGKPQDFHPVAQQ